MTGMSLLDVLRGVMLDPAEQAVYEADPATYLSQHGYEDVDAASLSDAFGLAADTLPAEQAIGAYQGGGGPEVPTMGADTTDFDVAPVDDPFGAEDAGPVEAVDHDPEGSDEATDTADDEFGGGFGDGDDAEVAADLPTDAGDLSFGRGDDIGDDVRDGEPLDVEPAVDQVASGGLAGDEPADVDFGADDTTGFDVGGPEDGDGPGGHDDLDHDVDHSVDDRDLDHDDDHGVEDIDIGSF